MGAVTHIRILVCMAGLVDYQNFEKGGTLQAFNYQSVNPLANEWIPWCSDPNDFLTRSIGITVQDATGSIGWNIWQCRDDDGDWIRYSDDGNYHGINSLDRRQPALRLPGDSDPGPDKILTITGLQISIMNI
jgi:hypothetical protein